MVRVDAASRRMLRARDKMDRSYDKPLDVAALARVALTSEAHFIRTFKQTFGELSSDVKSEISHRARAIKKIIRFFGDFTIHELDQ